jgi:hypothetical protein
MIRLATSWDFEREARSMIGEFANYSHYIHVIEEDAWIVTPQGLFGRFVPGALSPKAMQSALPVMRAVKTRVTNRGNAAAKGSMMPRIRKDGLLSATNEIPPEVNRLLGYSDQLGYLDAKKGSEKRGTDFCRRTGLTRRRPDYLENIMPAVMECDELFRDELPEQYAAQVAEIEAAGTFRISPAFSTANLNRDWQTTYHTDKYDLPNGWIALFALGDYEGGDLVVPRYRLRFNLRAGDVLFFKPHEVHGNLPFLGERLTVVLFGREHIAACGGR